MGHVDGLLLWAACRMSRMPTVGCWGSRAVSGHLGRSVLRRLPGANMRSLLARFSSQFGPRQSPAGRYGLTHGL